MDLPDIDADLAAAAKKAKPFKQPKTMERIESLVAATEEAKRELMAEKGWDVPDGDGPFSALGVTSMWNGVDIAATVDAGGPPPLRMKRVNGK